MLQHRHPEANDHHGDVAAVVVFVVVWRFSSSRYQKGVLNMLQAHLVASCPCHCHCLCPCPPRIRSNCSRASGPESGLVCSLPRGPAWPLTAGHHCCSSSPLPPLLLHLLPSQQQLCLTSSRWRGNYSLKASGIASVMLSCKLERASRALRMSESGMQAWAAACIPCTGQESPEKV